MHFRIDEGEFSFFLNNKKRHKSLVERRNEEETKLRMRRGQI